MTLRNLGQIAGMIVCELKSLDTAADDIAAFGAPGECFDLVCRGSEKRLQAMIADFEESTGYMLNELIQEFETRTTGKWLHNSGIAQVLFEEQQRREHEEFNRRCHKHRQRAKLPGGYGGAALGVLAQRHDKIERLRKELKERRYEEAARGNVERHLGDVCDGDDSADSVYDEAYTLAMDGASLAGADHATSAAIAQRVAQSIAQP